MYVRLKKAFGPKRTVAIYIIIVLFAMFIWGAVCLKSSLPLIFIYVVLHIVNVDSHL